MKNHLAMCLALLVGLVWVSSVVAVEPPIAPAKGPLVQYVEKPDPSYQFVKRREGELAGCSYVELTLTSQTWHDIVWKHQLYILKPKQVETPEQAILLIAGGGWRKELAEPPKPGNDQLPKEAILLAALATQIKAPVAVLLHVPQQPIFDGKSEDQIISYTFEQYFRTLDPTWPLLLPMVKSAVRGMDTVQKFAKNEWDLEIKNFTVTGASKRGWTTWLTSAVDSRVNSLAPMVIDMLNMEAQMKRQVESFGKFSEQLEDYTERGIQKYIGTPPGIALRSIVDPYSYRQVIQQPKLIMLGTNDRYWPLDALNLYWPGLEGPKNVLYIPNNGHGLKDTDRIVGSIVALHQQAAGKLKLAQMTWDVAQKDGALSFDLKADTKPQKVSAWMASSKTLDFRDSQWTSVTVEPNGDSYHYELKPTDTENHALFGEAVFATPGMPYFLSTNLKILEAKSASPAK